MFGVRGGSSPGKRRPIPTSRSVCGSSVLVEGNVLALTGFADCPRPLAVKVLLNLYGAGILVVTMITNPRSRMLGVHRRGRHHADRPRPVTTGSS
jgi:hypothetical protein